MGENATFNRKMEDLIIARKTWHMIKILKDIFETYLKLQTEKLKEYQLLHGDDRRNIEAGRTIENISNRYPASYEDAAIIFEEWCKGLLFECRPDSTHLKEYAEYVGSSEKFLEWMTSRKLNFRGENMRLVQKYEQNNRGYYCDITRKLDELCGYAATNPRYKHYIYDTRDLWDNCLAIRVPGRTTGSIEVGKNNVITKISFATDLIGDMKQYPDNIYREMEKYIGVALEI